MNGSKSSRTLRFSALLAVGVAIASIVPALDRAFTRRPPPSAEPATAPGPAKTVFDLRPPPGRWRLSTPQELQQTALPLSQILIAHRDATPGFALTGDEQEREWLARIAPKPTRTRQEALALTEQIRAASIADPNAFGALAQRYSDDSATRSTSGRLGLLAATPLHPLVLDAVAELSEREISAVVETGHGFHLWQLRPAPRRELISGERAVIPYGESFSRDAALALARELTSAARAQPSMLVELARSRAPHVDLSLTGDIGAWSTLDISADRAGAERELDVLSRLSLDAISEPIDSRHGFQIFRRTARSAASSYAYDGVFLRYDPKAGEQSEQSRAQVLSFARAIIDEVARNPARFSEFQAQYCCEQSVQWRAGFISTELAAILAPLAVGQLAPDPQIDAFHIAVARRAEPEPIEHPGATLFQLPRPGAPDLAWLMEVGEGARLAQTTRELGASARASLQLSGERAAQFDDVLSHLANVLDPSAPGVERRVLMQDGLSKLQKVLGPALFERFTSYMNEWVASRMLGRPTAAISDR